MIRLPTAFGDEYERNKKPAIQGGLTVRSEPFPARFTMGPEEQRAAMEVLSSFNSSSGKYFGGGVKVQQFERFWADSYGFKHGKARDKISVTFRNEDHSSAFCNTFGDISR